MSHEISAKSKGATTSLTAHQAKKISTVRRKREGRYGLIAGIGFFVALSVAVLIAVTVDPPAIFSRGLAQKTPATPPPQAVIGTITPDSTGGSRCRKMIFDNQTGRVTETSTPCQEVVRDETGAPKPVGTIHRLDAISKSFAR